MNQISLLDVMRILLGCAYLSDLRFLNGEQKRFLAQRLALIPADDADLPEWNDALEYLTGAGCLPSAEQARAALIAGLSRG